MKVKKEFLKEIGAKVDILNNRKQRILDIGENINNQIKNLKKKCQNKNEKIDENNTSIQFNKDSILNYKGKNK